MSIIQKQYKSITLADIEAYGGRYVEELSYLIGREYDADDDFAELTINEWLCAHKQQETNGEEKKVEAEVKWSDNLFDNMDAAHDFARKLINKFTSEIRKLKCVVVYESPESEGYYTTRLCDREEIKGEENTFTFVIY